MATRRSLLFPASLALAVLALAWLYHQHAPLRASVAFHHMASVRELSKGEFPPRHNLVEGYTPQAHYGPYLVLLGALARLAGAEPLAVLYAAGIVNMIAFAFAFRAAATRLVGDVAARWSVAAPLLLWGPWPTRAMTWSAWGWPGTTSLADAQNFFYPQHAAVVLLLLLLVLAVPRRTSKGVPRNNAHSRAHDRAQEREEAASARASYFSAPPNGTTVMGGGPAATESRSPLARAGLALLVAAILVASHPFTGMAMAPALGALAASEALSGRAAPLRTTFLLALPLAALGLAALWPYYPVLGLLRSFTVPGFREPLPGLAAPAGAPIAATLPAAPILSDLSILGPALLGFWGSAVLARGGRPFLLLWALADLLLSSFPLLPLRQRFFVFCATPLHLGATVVLERGWAGGWLGRAFVAGLLGAGALSAGHRIQWVLGQEVMELGFVERLAPPDAVILSDPRTSNAVAGLTGRKVVAPEGPDLLLLMEGGGRRTSDVQLFLTPGTPADARGSILRRWRVTHVLVDRLGQGGPELPYPAAYEGGGYTLYDVRETTRQH